MGDKLYKIRIHILAVVLGIGVLASQSVLAAWSSFGTFSLTNKTKVTTTTGKKLGVIKQSDSNEFSVNANAKTMWTDPDVRLVNSDLEVRSSFVEIKTTGTTYTGSNNTGTKGYTYYA